MRFASQTPLPPAPPGLARLLDLATASRAQCGLARVIHEPPAASAVGCGRRVYSAKAHSRGMNAAGVGDQGKRSIVPLAQNSFQSFKLFYRPALRDSLKTLKPCESTTDHGQLTTDGPQTLCLVPYALCSMPHVFPSPGSWLPYALHLTPLPTL